MDNLPQDLVRLILLKLRDTECLGRLKLVSRSWNFLISSQRFAAEHHTLHHSSSSPASSDANSILIARSPCFDHVVNFFTLLSGENHQKNNIYLPYIDCENEHPNSTLLLFEAGFGIYCIFDWFTNKVALWNPSIRELKILPSSPHYSLSKRQHSDQFDFGTGFGLVEYTTATTTTRAAADELGAFNYKVCRMILRTDREKKKEYFSIEYYSSNTRAWNILPDCYEVDDSDDSFKENTLWWVDGTNVNGRFHWFSWFSPKDIHIVWFDYTTDQIGRIELPTNYHNGGHERKYHMGRSRVTTVDNRYLCLLLSYTIGSNDLDDVYIEAWVMQE